MASWPWMKGAKHGALAIPTVSEHDKRPIVRDLIQENRIFIDQVRTELACDPLYQADKHDDLWILRFLLSHGSKVKPSVRAAKHTLLFRKEHNLDEKDIRFIPLDSEKCEATVMFRQYVEEGALRFVLPDPTRGVVGFLMIAGIDQHGLVENVNHEDWLETHRYLSEWTHQWSDYVTRTTGRLTKSIRIGDLTGITLAKYNREYQKRNAKVLGIMEDCYPQLLQEIFIVHAPGFIQGPWRLLRPILPKRVVEKIDFVAPDKKEHEKRRLYAFLSEEHLPVRYGGKYQAWPVDFGSPKVE